MLRSTERFAGNRGHVGFTQQAAGEVERRSNPVLAQKLRHVWKSVERPLRHRAADAGNGSEPCHDEVAPPPIFGAHLGDRVLRPEQRFDGRFLRD
jgi:hypothetical protein